MNYVKTVLPKEQKPDHFFFFASSSPDEFLNAVARARVVQPEGLLAVWRSVPRMPENVICCGPEAVPMVRCATCGQTTGAMF